MIAGANWRLRALAMKTAYHTVAWQYGSEGLPDLDELLGDAKPEAEVSRSAYHRRMREMGLE